MSRKWQPAPPEVKAFFDKLHLPTADDLKKEDRVRKSVQHQLAVDGGYVRPPWMEQPRSKPGSAAAWIDELWPTGNWRLLTGKDVHDRIVREAEKRGIKKWPSYSAVLLELKRCRTSK